MHNGYFKTLREVIDYYDDPARHLPNGMNRDSLLLQPLGLTEMEKQDLEAFLHALTDDQFVRKQ
jgi:cytochrome c peroxidase